MELRPSQTLLIIFSLSIVVLGKELDIYIEDSDRFPGWRGELPQASQDVGSVDTIGFGELGREIWRGGVEQISWKPRAFLLHGFLSDEECEHLKKLAKPTLSKSTVVDSATGKSMDSTVRTSKGTFLRKNHDDIVARIEKRLAMVTMLPEENGEALQILEYVDGQKYEPHTDYFHDQLNQDRSHGGQRVATVLMYLSTPEEGGETVFPHAEKKVVSGPGWSDCASKGLAVKAKKGNALFFYSLKPDGSEDIASTHGSCPTTKGVKWSATRWIHVDAFNSGATSSDCIDQHDKCEEWAILGECEKNSAFMLESCKKACNACSDKLLKSVGRKGSVGATV